MEAIVDLVLRLVPLALVSFGGGQGLLPEIQRLAVDVEHWMTAAQFSELYAIAQSSPGPNAMMVPLVVSIPLGFAGAVAAVFALVVPTSLLTFVAARFRDGLMRSRWHAVVQNGLAPVTLGLLVASSYIITLGADRNLQAAAVTGVGAVITYRTKVHPLWVIGAGALLGLVGLVPA